MDKPLKNCPCCNSPAKDMRTVDQRGLFYFIACTKCSMRSKKPTKWEAIIDWNRRYQDEI